MCFMHYTNTHHSESERLRERPCKLYTMHCLLYTTIHSTHCTVHCILYTEEAVSSVVLWDLP